jgi:hypothetical protein
MVTTIDPNKTAQASMIRGKLFEMLVFLDPSIGKDHGSEDSCFYQRTNRMPEAQEILYILQNPQFYPQIYGQTKGIKNPDAIFLNPNSTQIEIIGVGDAKLGIIDIGDIKQLSLFKRSLEIITQVLNQYTYKDLEGMGFKALSARKYMLGEKKPLLKVSDSTWQQIIYVPRDRNILNPFNVSFEKYYTHIKTHLLDKSLTTKKGDSKAEKMLRKLLRFTYFVPTAFSKNEIVRMAQHINENLNIPVAERSNIYI